ncbi:hypothetical protein KBY29_16045 [Ruegeria pomeroyi]|nr:hypothetical protein [Ruegeria pomeroyi]
MPVAPVFFFLIAGPLAIAIVWVLASLPAYPNSPKARVFWFAALFLVFGFLIFGRLSLHSPRVWQPPVQADIARGLFLVLPFVGSLLLWRYQRTATARLSAAKSTLIVLAICILSVLGLRQFNKSCVYFDYWNDQGQAWCPVTWQAKLGT